MKITVEPVVAEPGRVWHAWNNPAGNQAMEQRVGRLAYDAEHG